MKLATMIAERCKKIMEEKGITKTQLIKTSKLSSSTIDNVLQGKSDDVSLNSDDDLASEEVDTFQQKLAADATDSFDDFSSFDDGSFFEEEDTASGETQEAAVEDVDESIPMAEENTPAAADDEGIEPESTSEEPQASTEPQKEAEQDSFVVQFDTDDFGDYNEEENFDDFGETDSLHADPSDLSAADENPHHTDSDQTDWKSDLLAGYADEDNYQDDDGFTIDFSLFEDADDEKVDESAQETPTVPEHTESSSKKSKRKHKKKK